jgi:signal transduction histidine kinase
MATADLPDNVAVKNLQHFWHFRLIARTLERSMRGAGPVAAVRMSPAELLFPSAARESWSQSRTRTFGLAVLAIAATWAAAELALIEGSAAMLAFVICATVLTVGTMNAIEVARTRTITKAIVQERHRIARDLHDGLAQELAYIRMEAMRMAAGQDERATRLARAAERALEESRGAIDSLRRDHESSFSVELAQVAEELTDRAGARLSLELEPGMEIQPECRQALVRILREAITNGVRHGCATEVALELSGGDGVRMAVRDNGAGFEPGGPRRPGSFGLTTMRERAQAMGGDLTIQSDPGEGTIVEVVLP